MQEKFQTNRAGCAGDNGRAGFARLFFSILQLCPRRPGRNFSNLKFPSGPTFALQLLPGRGRGRGVFIALDNVALAAATRRVRGGGCAND